MPPKSYSFAGVRGLATIPQGGTDSNVITTPERAKTLAVFIPALEGVTTLAVHAMVPRADLEGAAEVFMPVSVFDLTDGTFEALDGLVGPNICITIPVSALGTGVFKFVASGAQTSAARLIELFFNFGD